MQDVAAILIVIAAAGVLAWRGWRSISHRRAGACGSCANCGSSSTQRLYTLDANMHHAKAPRREEASK